VVRFAGSKVFLDEETTFRIQDQLLALAEESNRQTVVLDFTNVDCLSSTALGALVHLHKCLIAAGRHLTIKDLHPQVYEVFTVTRLDTILDLKPLARQDSPE
jgi:anti-sigma B factor antagonist